MKRIILLFFMTLSTYFSIAQTNDAQQIVTTSISNKDAKFLLFPTKNIHIFLKLNTRTGEVYMVQYSLEKENRVQIKLSPYPLVKKDEQSNGRFFLYPTTNFYNFILLDQIDGRTWQVQWHTDKDKRMVERIYNDTKLYLPQDSVLINDLTLEENLYFKGGELFSGYVWSNDGKTILADCTDGRISYFRISHNNDETAIFFDRDSKGIEDEDANLYYNEKDEKITLNEFKKDYPSLFEKAKTAYKEFLNE